MFYFGLILGLILGSIATLLISRNNKVKAAKVAEDLNEGLEDLHEKVKAEIKKVAKK